MSDENLNPPVTDTTTVDGTTTTTADTTTDTTTVDESGNDLLHADPEKGSEDESDASLKNGPTLHDEDLNAEPTVDAENSYKEPQDVEAGPNALVEDQQTRDELMDDARAEAVKNHNAEQENQ